MQYKQGSNCNKGEWRTGNILIDRFILHKITPDIEGRDFMAEIRNESVGNIINSKEKIYVFGIIQSKFFEKNNEVKILKNYVEDKDGIKTEFFAFLHTADSNGNEHCYFFTALEIKQNFQLSLRKNGAEYYVFRLTKINQFENFKNIPKKTINDRIEEGIRKTEEYRNQKNIQNIRDGFYNPTEKIFNDSNKELFEQIKNKHIVDKLYLALNSYKDFRRITAWRLIDKISFKTVPNSITHFDRFTISTNNQEIIDLFENIGITDEIIIKNKIFFKSVKQYPEKINKIIELLNNNGIVKIHSISNRKIINIYKLTKNIDDSPDDFFFKLNFYSANKLLNDDQKRSSNNWQKMQNAYTLFMLGKYKQAKDILSIVKNDTYENNEHVINFFANYNLRIIAFSTWENEYPSLKHVLFRTNLSTEKKDILEFFINDNFLKDYLKDIDELSLKIKEYSQRSVIANTNELFIKLYSKLGEYQNFISGNWLFTNIKDEFEILVNKVIEASIISYSLRTQYGHHLNHLDDSLIAHAIHYCEPNTLLGYFQRNGITSIDYKPTNDYFNDCIQNLFSKNNVDYLYKEIVYFNGKTKNIDLRRKVERVFGNICVLISYLNYNNPIKDLATQLIYFIEKLDFKVNNLSLLALPILHNPSLFSEEDLLKLVEVILKKDKTGENYLLTNCLYGLNEKGYYFDEKNNLLCDTLISIAIVNPRFEILNVLPKILKSGYKNKLKIGVINSINDKFNYSLYYYSVISGILDQPILFFDQYLNQIKYLLETEIKVHLFTSFSPYTGLDKSLGENLNKLVEIIYSMRDNIDVNNEIIKKVIDLHPYYEFLLNIDSFKQSDNFNLIWLLENPSDIILKKLSQNLELKKTIDNLIKSNNNKELMKIYINYFC